MSKSQETYNKKEKEKKRLKKRQDKLLKKAERKENAPGGGLENMMAYVDENGMISDTPPDPTVKKKIIKASSIEIGVPKRDDADVPSERTGRIEFFNDEKGFGFIKEDETGEKFFVHINGCIDEVIENDKVQFELEQGLKGINAVRVKKIKANVTSTPVVDEEKGKEEGDSESESEGEETETSAEESKSESKGEEEE